MEVVSYWRSSSFEAFLFRFGPLSLSLKFEEDPTRYSTFNILRLSVIGGCLYFKHFLFWFGLLSLSFKFEEDPILGCGDIQHLIFYYLGSLNTLLWSQKLAKIRLVFVI